MTLAKSQSRAVPRAFLPLQNKQLFEAECVPGLEDFAARELSALKGITQSHPVHEGLRFFAADGLAQLRELKFVQSVYRVAHFDVPRPKAILGDAHWRTLIGAARDVIGNNRDFKTLRLAAAGEESAVMLRIRDLLCGQLGLVPAEEGDLLIRLMTGAMGGWDALIRITPRPLATRGWRVCNYEGALNAVVARCMAAMLFDEDSLPAHGGTSTARLDVSPSFPRKRESSDSTRQVLNVCCGSGTLMIEAADSLRDVAITGCDISTHALECARTNLVAYAAQRNVRLVRQVDSRFRGNDDRNNALQPEPWDATRLPLASGCVDGVLADLPFGNLIGSYAANRALYPALLDEAARVAKPGAHFVLISNEAKLMRELLAAYALVWGLAHERVITLRGLHPRIYTLQRK